MLTRSEIHLISHLKSQYLPEMALSGFSGKNSEISFQVKAPGPCIVIMLPKHIVEFPRPHFPHQEYGSNNRHQAELPRAD